MTRDPSSDRSRLGEVAALFFKLGAATLVSWPAVGIAALAAVAVLRLRLSVVWAVLGGWM